jgi:hypothetical protein
MTPAELKAIRKTLGLTTTQFGIALGFSGNTDRRPQDPDRPEEAGTVRTNNPGRTIRRLESGEREITPEIAAEALRLRDRGSNNGD